MDPGEQRFPDQIDQFIMERIQSITVEPLRTGNELFVPFGVGLFLFVAQHGVACDIDWIACNVEPYVFQPAEKE